MSIDWQLLWHMNGHGPYVWGSYALGLMLLGAEAWGLWQRHRHTRRQRQRRQAGSVEATRIHGGNP